MSTKEKIVETALRLFNEQGVEVVTIRHIAKEVGISHGNLCYHFPNTETIIIRLYDQLVEQLSSRISEVEAPGTVTLTALADLAKETLTSLYQYRFLMLDFAGIMRQIPVLRIRHRMLVIGRKATFRQLIRQLRSVNSVRDELYPGYDEDLLEQLFIVGDFWLASATIVYEEPVDEKLAHYQRVFLSLIIPLLTEKGMAEWQTLNLFS